MRYPRNVQVGKLDVYEARFSSKWLGTDIIAACQVTASSALVTIGDVSISGNSVLFEITGVTAGEVELSFELTATPSGRGLCRHASVMVEDC
jgi:hypothetical protein